jgi:hypothetical protein
MQLVPHAASRYGTLSLYAVIDTKTGKVHGKIAARHPSEEFLAFLEDVEPFPPGQGIRLILDNYRTITRSSFSRSW